MGNNCISCGAVIPEGRQVCPCCENLPKTRLAEYEEKLAQGLLIELPCRIGETIYIVFQRRYRVGGEYHWHIQKTRLTYGNMARVIKEFGEYVFTRRMYAEKRAKELREKGV